VGEDDSVGDSLRGELLGEAIPWAAGWAKQGRANQSKAGGRSVGLVGGVGDAISTKARSVPLAE
jgi:hypothetical protein